MVKYYVHRFHGVLWEQEECKELVGKLRIPPILNHSVRRH